MISVEALCDVDDDVLQHALRTLPTHPDLFRAMRTCKRWHEAARRICDVERTHRVARDADVAAVVRGAGPGDTVVLSGTHELRDGSGVVCSVPLRIVGRDACRIVGKSFRGELLRFEASAVLQDVSVALLGARRTPTSSCRTVSVEAGVVRILRTTITQEDVADPHDCLETGLWIGHSAAVLMRDSCVEEMSGPCVKVQGGHLVAHNSTIKGVRYGSGIVVVDALVDLLQCHIKNNRSDGVSLWKCSALTATRCVFVDNFFSDVSLHMNSTAEFLHCRFGRGVMP